MSALDLDLLASIASGGLGRWVDTPEGGQAYVKDDDCIGCLKDLQRIYRSDDFLNEKSIRPAFNAISQYNFPRTDLVPLIVTYPEDYDVVYNALKVCTLLTQTDDVQGSESFQLAHMLPVCDAFLARDALTIIVSLLAEPLSRHPKMTPKDASLVQLVITFLKNLCAVAAAAARLNISGAQRIKAVLIQRFMEENVIDLLFIMSQHARERPFKNDAQVLMEIFLHVFTDLSPQETLAALSRHKDSPALDPLSAAALKAKAKAAAAAAAATADVDTKNTVRGHGQQRASGKMYAGRPTTSRPSVPPSRSRQPIKPPGLPMHRPSFAGAVYVRRHVDHSSDVLVRTSATQAELPKLNSNVNRKHAQAARNDKVLLKPLVPASGPAATGNGAAGTTSGTVGTVVNTTLYSEYHLQQLAVLFERFLNEAYAPLMSHIQRELQPGLHISRLTDDDFANFMVLVRHCTGFVRLRQEQALAAKVKQGQRQTPTAGNGKTAAEAADDINREEGAGEDKDKQEESEASPFSCISTTLSWETFHMLTMLWVASMQASKPKTMKELKLNSLGLQTWELVHVVVPLFKELLLTLDLARVAGNTADKLAANRVQRRLLHDDQKDSGLLPVLVRLIRTYNYRFQARSYAVDLVETLHVVLSTLDKLSAEGLQVKQKYHGRSRKKYTAPKASNKERPTPEPQALVEEGQAPPAAAAENDGQGTQTDAADGSSTPLSQQAAAGTDNPVDMDAAAGAVADADNAAAIDKDEDILAFLPSLDLGAPLAPPPAATTPKDGTAAEEPSTMAVEPSIDLGQLPINPETAAEAMAGSPTKVAQSPCKSGLVDGDAALLTDGCAAPEKPAGDAEQQPEQQAGTNPEEVKGSEGEDADESDSEDEEEEERRPALHEVAFDVNKRVKQECALPVVVHFYSWLLEGYKTNSPFTNHAILSMFKRLSDPQGLDLEPMLYQMSVLRVMHAVLADASIRNKPQFTDLYAFCKRVVRNVLTKIAPEKYKKREEDVAGKERNAKQAQQGSDTAIDLVGGSDEEDDEMDEEEKERKQKKEEMDKRFAECELKMKKDLIPGMTCVELLFWKGPNVAAVIRDDYNWKKAMEYAAIMFRPSNGGDGAGAQFAFASYKERQNGFTEDQSLQLAEAFESLNGYKDCLDRLVEHFAGEFKKTHIAKQLKALSLARGAVTPSQQRLLQQLYPDYKEKPNCFELLAEELAAGFTAKQIKNQLRKIGVLPSVGGKGGNRAGYSKPTTMGGGLGDWSDDDDLDLPSAAPALNAEQRFDAVFGSDGDGSDDEESEVESSDDEKESDDDEHMEQTEAAGSGPPPATAAAGDEDRDRVGAREKQERGRLKKRRSDKGKREQERMRREEAVSPGLGPDLGPGRATSDNDDNDDHDHVEGAEKQEKEGDEASPAVRGEGGSAGGKRDRSSLDDDEEAEVAAARRRNALEELKKRRMRVQGADVEPETAVAATPAAAEGAVVDAAPQEDNAMPLEGVPTADATGKVAGENSPNENDGQANGGNGMKKKKKGGRLLKKSRAEVQPEVVPMMQDLEDF